MFLLKPEHVRFLLNLSLPVRLADQPSSAAGLAGGWRLPPPYFTVTTVKKPAPAGDDQPSRTGQVKIRAEPVHSLKKMSGLLTMYSTLHEKSCRHISLSLAM